MMLVLMLIFVIIVIVMVVMMLVLIFVIIVVVMVMMVLVLILILVMMMVMMLVFVLFRFLQMLFQEFAKRSLLEFLGILHRLQDLRAGDLLPVRCDQICRGIQASDQLDRFRQFRFGAFAGTAQDHSLRGLDLIVEELTEILHIHFALHGVHNGDRASEHRVRSRYGIVHRNDNIRKLADARRLDDDPVRMIGRKDFLQGRFKISDQRAADAAGIHFFDFHAGFL